MDTSTTGTLVPIIATSMGKGSSTASTITKRIFDVSPGAPLIVDPDGRKVPEEAVVEHLRFARTLRVSIEGNAGLCRGLLATRYGLREKEEEVGA